MFRCAMTKITCGLRRAFATPDERAAGELNEQSGSVEALRLLSSQRRLSK